MIYVTGDTHGDFTRFNTRNFPEQKEMTKDDYVIILGDFGGVWDWKGESRAEEHELKMLQDRSFTTLFIDGNHENHKRLNAFPIKEWNGGLVHEIRPSVLHLMRGQVFKIEGKSIFTFGGASSHDIDGGLLNPADPLFDDKRKKLNRGTLPYRIIGRSWWAEELPSKVEMGTGLENLEKAGWKVDYVLTHCASTSTQALLSHGWYKNDMLTDYLEEIRSKLNYKKWLFGHYHDNRYINDKDILLYEQITMLPTEKSRSIFEEMEEDMEK